MTITIKKHLILEFIKAMEDIGEYGAVNHRETNFESAARRGDRIRSVRAASNIYHALDHLENYSDKTKHDHFGTLKHQLAAVAFNVMMEFYYASLDEEPEPEITTEKRKG